MPPPLHANIPNTFAPLLQNTTTLKDKMFICSWNPRFISAFCPEFVHIQFQYLSICSHLTGIIFDENVLSCWNTIYDLSLVPVKIRTRTSQDKVQTKPVHLYWNMALTVSYSDSSWQKSATNINRTPHKRPALLYADAGQRDGGRFDAGRFDAGQPLIWLILIYVLHHPAKHVKEEYEPLFKLLFYLLLIIFCEYQYNNDIFP